MVRSREDESAVWVEDGGVEDFRLEQIGSFELLCRGTADRGPRG